MRLISTVYRYELTRHFIRRGYLLLTFGLPIVALIGFGIYGLIDRAGGDENSQDTELQQTIEDLGPIGYVDSGNQLTTTPTDAFADKVFRYPDESVAQEALKQDEIASYFVLANDYLATGEADLVTESLDLDLSDDTNLFELYLLNHFLTEDTSQLFIRLQNPLNLQQHTIERGTSTVETVNEGDELDEFWVAYVFGMVLLISTLTSSGYMMSSVIEERETRMIEIIISSVRPGPLLTGKILAMGSLGLLQVMVWIATITIVVSQLGADIIDVESFEISAYTLVITIVYFILGFLLMGAAYAGIGAVSGSLREGSQLITIVVLPSVAPLWLLVAITNNPEGTIAVVLSLIPITAPLTMVIRATQMTIPPLELIASLAILVTAVYGFIWAAGRLFRVGVLLTGSLPSVRQIARYIFENPQQAATRLSKTDNL